MDQTTHTGSTIESVTAAVYEILTDQPEADGTLTWTATTLVAAARVHAADQAGLGYTYAAGACQPLIEDVLADAVTGRSALDVPGVASDGPGHPEPGPTRTGVVRDLSRGHCAVGPEGPPARPAGLSAARRRPRPGADLR